MSTIITAAKNFYMQALKDKTANAEKFIKFLRKESTLKLAVEDGLCDNSSQMEALIAQVISKPLALLSDKKGTGGKLQRLSPTSERPFPHTPGSLKLWNFLASVSVYKKYVGKIGELNAKRKNKNKPSIKLSKFVLTDGSITCRKDIKLMYKLVKYLTLCGSELVHGGNFFGTRREYKDPSRDPKLVVNVEAYYEMLFPDSYIKYRSEGNRSKSFYAKAIDEICPAPVKKRVTKTKTTGCSAEKVVLVESGPSQQLTKDVKGKGKENNSVETPIHPSPVDVKAQEESSSVEKPHEPSTEESRSNTNESPVPGPSVSKEKLQQVQEIRSRHPDLEDEEDLDEVIRLDGARKKIDELKAECVAAKNMYAGVINYNSGREILLAAKKYLEEAKANGIAVDKALEEKQKNKDKLFPGLKRRYTIIQEKYKALGLDITDSGELYRTLTLEYLEKNLDDTWLRNLEEDFPDYESYFIKDLKIASKSLNDPITSARFLKATTRDGGTSYFKDRFSALIPEGEEWRWGYILNADYIDDLEDELYSLHRRETSIVNRLREKGFGDDYIRAWDEEAFRSKLSLIDLDHDEEVVSSVYDID